MRLWMSWRGTGGEEGVRDYFGDLTSCGRVGWAEVRQVGRWDTGFCGGAARIAAHYFSGSKILYPEVKCRVWGYIFEGLTDWWVFVADGFGDYFRDLASCGLGGGSEVWQVVGSGARFTGSAAWVAAHYGTRSQALGVGVEGMSGGYVLERLSGYRVVEGCGV